MGTINSFLDQKCSIEKWKMTEFEIRIIGYVTYGNMIFVIMENHPQNGRILK